MNKDDRLDLSLYKGCKSMGPSHASKVVRALQAAYDEIDKLLVPMTVTEQDYRNIMKVNKGIGDMYKEAEAEIDRLKGKLALTEAGRDGLYKGAVKQIGEVEADRDELKGILAIDMLATIKLRSERDALAEALGAWLDVAYTHTPDAKYDDAVAKARAALARVAPKPDAGQPAP